MTVYKLVADMHLKVLKQHVIGHIKVLVKVQYLKVNDFAFNNKKIIV